MILIFFNGSTAVLLFYALSGAVLCQSLMKNRLDISSVLLFLMRRALRLFPALLLCMLSMWLLSLVLRGSGVIFPVVGFYDAILNSALINTNLHGPSTSVQIELLATPFVLFFAFIYQRFFLATVIIIFSLSIFAIQRADIVLFLPNMHANTFP